MNKLILITALFVSVVSNASEESWSKGSVTLPTLGNTLSGFVTDTGSFRIDNLGKVKANFSISGGYFSMFKKNIHAFCSGVGSTLHSTKVKTNNSYELNGFIYPLTESELLQSELKIENRPHLVSVVAKMNLGSDSFLDQATVKDFEQQLSKILNANIVDIEKSGTFKVQLSQVDDVMCDLLVGHSQLELNYTVSYELAKHERTVVITPNDFSLVYDYMKKTSNKGTTVASRNLVFGAQLAQAFKVQLNKSLDDVRQDNFVRIASAILDIDKAVLKNISVSQYEQVAKSTDELKIYWAPDIQNVNLIPQVAE